MFLQATIKRSGGSSLARRVFLVQETLLHFVSVHPSVCMGTGDILFGGNPAMDYHPVQGSSNTPRLASC